MNKSMAGVGLIALGIVGLYLGATGNLESFWLGLTGKCGGSTEERPTGDVSGGDGQTNADSVAQLISARGGYYPSPTGAMMYSDAGQW